MYAEVFTLERELYRYPVLKLPGTGLRPVAYQAIVAPFPGTLPRNLCVSCSHSHCYAQFTLTVRFFCIQYRIQYRKEMGIEPNGIFIGN